MVTIACVEKKENGWYAKVDYGRLTDLFGPYRWRWVARLVAWLEDGEH